MLRYLVQLLLFILYLSTSAVVADNLKLIILHNNDMHSRFEETSKNSGRCPLLGSNACYGGFARVAHLLRKYRSESDEGKGPPVLYLNAGDTYTGTPWFVIHKWDIVIDFLNILKPDAASLGNHEFDKGVPGLIPYLEKANFPIVTANVIDDRLVNLKKSTILTVNGYKIGIIGYLTPQTIEISEASDVKITDEVEAVNEECERMKRDNIKTVFAVGHSGYEMDQKIARECNCVDIVIGGHTNTFLWPDPKRKPNSEVPEGPYPTMVTSNWGKKVPVVQAYAYTKYLGKLTVTIDKNTGKITSYEGDPILLDSSIPQEPDVLQILDKYRTEIQMLDKQVIGKAKVYLEGTDVACRRRECNLGNLITDSLIDYRARQYRGQYWTDIPIAIINGGAIRMSVDATHKDGNITQTDVAGIMPFNNDIYSVLLSGQELMHILEFSVHANRNTSEGEFLQYSGIKVVYDRTQQSGRRLVTAQVRCAHCSVPRYEPIVLHKDYRVMLPSFLAQGGDGYRLLKTARNKTNEGINDFDCLVSYFKSHHTVFPAEEGRISFSMLKSGVSRKDFNLFIVAVVLILLYYCNY